MDNRRLPLILLITTAVIALGTVATIQRAHAATIVELSIADGSSVCPSTLSGFGQAQWDPRSNTCTLFTTSPVSPTLCIRGTVGGCVLAAIDIVQIDHGVTFAINTTMGGVAVYSRLDNYGTVAANDVGIANYGTINNWGLVTVSPLSDILNLPYTGQGIINNYNNGTIINRGVIANGGTINNSGLITKYCPGIIQQNPILGNPVQSHPCAPLAPMITTPSGSVFQTMRPTITGVSQENVTIALFDGTDPVGKTVSDFTGNWSITTYPLRLGFHNLTATATNSLGTSPPSRPLTIRIEHKHTATLFVTEIPLNGSMTSAGLVAALSAIGVQVGVGVTLLAKTRISCRYCKTLWTQSTKGAVHTAAA